MKPEQIKKIESDLAEMQHVLASLRNDVNSNPQMLADMERDIDFLQKSFIKTKGMEEPQRSYKFNPRAEVANDVEDKKAITLDAQILSVHAFIKQLRMELESDPEPWMEHDLVMQEHIYHSLLALRNYNLADRAWLLVNINEFERPFNLETQFSFVQALIKGLGTDNKGPNSVKLTQMLTAIEQNLCVARWVGEVTADILLGRKGNKPGETTPEHDLFNASVKALNLITCLEPNSIEERDQKKEVSRLLIEAIKGVAGDEYHFADDAQDDDDQDGEQTGDYNRHEEAERLYKIQHELK